jgi:hypothetical protein
MKFRLFLTFLLFFGFAVHAESPLKFKTWREQQILEAQNEVLRISARLHQQKSNPKSAQDASSSDDFLITGRFERAPEVTDRDLKSAQESLTSARELNVEDYAAVYVATLKDQDPEQFSKLMDSLSKEELAQLMKALVKNKVEDHPDASHNLHSPTPVAALTSSSS